MSDGFDPALFEPLAAIEDRHFWFRARNRVIAAVAARLVARLASGFRVLEVGCGAGNVLRVLETTCRGGLLTGMDLFGEGLAHARRRTRCPLVAADLRRPPFRCGFDLIGAFDVIEHLEDDREALADLRRLLNPGGRLLVTVPAHRSLWSYFDEAAHHARRYEAAELEEKLTAAGYRVEYLTPYMLSLYPLLWLARRAAGRLDRRPAAQQLTQRDLRIYPVLNRLLEWALAPEARLIARRRRLPLGTSLLAIAAADTATPNSAR